MHVREETPRPSVTESPRTRSATRKSAVTDPASALRLRPLSLGPRGRLQPGRRQRNRVKEAPRTLDADAGRGRWTQAARTVPGVLLAGAPSAVQRDDLLPADARLADGTLLPAGTRLQPLGGTRGHGSGRAARSRSHVWDPETGTGPPGRPADLCVAILFYATLGEKNLKGAVLLFFSYFHIYGNKTWVCEALAVLSHLDSVGRVPVSDIQLLGPPMEAKCARKDNARD